MTASGYSHKLWITLWKGCEQARQLVEFQAPRRLWSISIQFLYLLEQQKVTVVFPERAGTLKIKGAILRGPAPPVHKSAAGG